MSAETGMVKIQAQKILVVTPHFTAEAPFFDNPHGRASMKYGQLQHLRAVYNEVSRRARQEMAKTNRKIMQHHHEQAEPGSDRQHCLAQCISRIFPHHGGQDRWDALVLGPQLLRPAR